MTESDCNQPTYFAEAQLVISPAHILGLVDALFKICNPQTYRFVAV